MNKPLLAKHILLLGGIGVGKTNTFNYLLKDMFEKSRTEVKDNVTVIFDTKGDFFEEFHSPGDIVIANGKAFEDTTYYWNIFKDIKAAGDDESQELMCREIAKALFSEHQPAIRKTNRTRQSQRTNEFVAKLDLTLDNVLARPRSYCQS